MKPLSAHPTPRATRALTRLSPIAPAPALALLLTLCLPGLAPPAHSAPPRPLPPIPDNLPAATGFTLDNGLTVLLVPNAANPILEVQLAFRVGAGADAPGKEGTASMLARMMTTGLDGLPEQALARELARIGAWISADAGLDSFSIGGQVPTFDNADTLRFLDLFARIVLEAPLAPDLLEREKTLRLGLLSRALDNADALANIAARAVAQPGPHGRPTFGTTSSIPTLARQDLTFFRDRVFSPNNAVLVIGGALSEPGLTDWLLERFGSWQLATWSSATPSTLEPGPLPGRPARLCRDGACLANLVAPLPSPAPGPSTLLVTVEDPNLSQVPFRLAATNPISMVDPRWPAFRIGTFMLGGDFTSRLMQSLRVREGLTYGAYFSPDFGAHVSGTMMVSTDATPDALIKAIRLARAEVEALRDSPIDPDELERSRLMLVESFAFKLETISKTLEQYSSLMTAELPLSWLASWKPSLSGPTPEEVRQSLALIRPETMHLVVAGPASLAPELQKLGHGTLRVVSARDLLGSGLVNARP